MRVILATKSFNAVLASPLNTSLVPGKAYDLLLCLLLATAYREASFLQMAVSGEPDNSKIYDRPKRVRQGRWRQHDQTSRYKTRSISYSKPVRHKIKPHPENPRPKFRLRLRPDSEARRRSRSGDGPGLRTRRCWNPPVAQRTQNSSVSASPRDGSQTRPGP